jgi:UDP-N-acetylmuramate dehydrogenase
MIAFHSFTTFGVPATANALIHADTPALLIDALQSAYATNTQWLVLGGGSNLLITQHFSGTIIRNELRGIALVEETYEHIILDVQAGENWHEFVIYCVERNWGGIENLALIPGTVGAAPVQNIGAYGVELRETLVSVTGYDTEQQSVRTLTNEECQFGYRSSIFKHDLKGRFVIMSVRLQLSKHPQLRTNYGSVEMLLKHIPLAERTIRDVCETVILIRKSKLPDPAQIGNAGSFFKNPEIPSAHAKEILVEYPSAPIFPLKHLAGKAIAIPIQVRVLPVCIVSRHWYW